MSSIPVHFQKAVSTLQMVSYDESSDSYMTDSSIEVYNFDNIQKWYANKLAANVDKSNVPTNDALYIGRDRMLFIEFKNGKIDRGKNRNDLKFKIYNSHLIITDSITETGKLLDGYKPNTKYTREHVDYMLVYNGDKNPSSSKNKIRNIVSWKSGKGIKARFGLAYLEGYLFRKVRTYTEKEFQVNFVDRVKMGEDYV